jgi:hypothetical protein
MRETKISVPVIVLCLVNLVGSTHVHAGTIFTLFQNMPADFQLYHLVDQV